MYAYLIVFRSRVYNSNKVLIIVLSILSFLTLNYITEK